MVEEHESGIENETMSIELVTGEFTHIEGQLLAVNRAEIGDRRVDYLIRIYNGELQEKRDYYDGGQLFYSDEWISPAELYVSEGGIKTRHPGNDDPMDPTEWAEKYSRDLVSEFTIDAWPEMKEDHGQNS